MPPRSEPQPTPASPTKVGEATRESTPAKAAEATKAAATATPAAKTNAPPAKAAAPAGKARAAKASAAPGVSPAVVRGGGKSSAASEPAPPSDFSADSWREDHQPGPGLFVALLFALAGGLALAFVGFVRVSPAAGPGFVSWPWLVLLALGPVLGALGLARRRPRLAGGVLLGLAGLAPGRLVLDLQFAVNGPLTIRPELYLPDRFLGDSPVGAGFWLLLAGHLLTAVAGVLAWRALRRPDDEAAEPRRWRLLVPLLAVVGSVGLLTAPLRSGNGFLLARGAFEGPWPALGGYLLLAAALPFVAVLALAAPSESVARGTLWGLAAAAFGVGVPPVAAGLSRDDLGVTWGPVAVLVAVAGVAVLAGTRLTVAQTGDTGHDLAGGADLPGLFWWRLTTGVLGLAGALAAVIGTFAPQVAVTALDAVVPVSAAAESPARWSLLAAAIVVAVLALGILVPATASVARVLLGLAWAGIVLAGTAVLNTALTATQAGNLAGFGGATGAAPVVTYDLGAGAAWTFAALVLAALAGLAAVGTGVVEREDAADGTQPGSGVLTPVVAGAVLAVAAFGLPVFDVPGYVAPGLWSHFDTPSWGLLTAAVVVVGAAALALRSRPRPAAVLLTGAALLVALRAGELPLVGTTLGDASPDTGFWTALAAVLALLLAAAMSAAGTRRKTAGTRRTTSGAGRTTAGTRRTT